MTATSKRAPSRRVALFATCVGDVAFPSAVESTVILLERLGVQVEFPDSQGCCGQMHINSGYPDMALAMVRTFVDAFEGFDAVVAPSGSCVGSIRHQMASVAQRAGDELLAARVESVVPHVRELTEFIVDDLGVVDVGASFPHRVAYHPSCHSLRVARVGDRPYQLLRNVSGLTLVEQEQADSCCGFGGTFSVKNSAVSSAMLDDKMRYLRAVDAEFVTSLDASCLMQIGGGLQHAESGIRAVHLAEILAGTVR